MRKEKAILFWSGGKDSAFALQHIQQQKKIEIVALVTTINAEYNRVSMHGIRVDLLEKQAESIGIPLVKMVVKESTNSAYEAKLIEILLKFKQQGISKVVYGDIFLEDLKEYRNNLLQKLDMEGVYPLWGKNTSKLVVDFLNQGFSTIVCCVYSKVLSKKEVGKKLDRSFITELPKGVDSCGENGEFHTFCFDGPIFKTPLSFTTGNVVFKPIKLVKTKETEGFWFCDLIPLC